MAQPLLGRLHARGERVTVAALPHIAPLFEAMPAVAQVLVLPFAHGRLDWSARRALGRALRGQFDAAYVLPNSWKSALLPWLGGIPRRVGYHGEARFGVLTQRLANPTSARPAMVPFYSALSGEPGTAADRPELVVPPNVLRDTLAQLALPPLYTVLAPGSEYGGAKRWPVSRYAELALQLAHPVVLLGSQKEAALCAELAAGVLRERARGPAVLDLSGRTSLVQAIAVVAQAHHVVTNDSGLMHIAAALGVAQTAIFGSSSPLHTPPNNPQARVLWLKTDPHYQPSLDCAPCFSRECPLGHLRCLNDISAARVAQGIGVV